MANPIDMLNPPRMYRIRPYFEIKKVRLPDCMYLMKPVHQLTNMAPSSKEASSSSLSYLEKRQEWVLSQINKLQKKVQVLAENLGVGPAEVGILQQQASSATTLRDVVISCPTNAPPYALRSLYHYISKCVPASCQVHTHSSATTLVTGDLSNFWSSMPTSSKPILKVTLIWKCVSECPSPTMLVSPHGQTPVEGVANIGRYLCREYFPALYEEGPGGAESAGLMDSWLDAITTTLQRGNAKEKAGILRRLNAQLGSTQFLAGNQPSLADIVGYCGVCEQTGLKLPGNVKNWLKRVQLSLPGLNSVPCPYLNDQPS